MSMFNVKEKSKSSANLDFTIASLPLMSNFKDKKNILYTTVGSPASVWLRDRMSWYTNMESISGVSHCPLPVPVWGGSASATSLNIHHNKFKMKSNEVIEKILS